MNEESLRVMVRGWIAEAARLVARSNLKFFPNRFRFQKYDAFAFRQDLKAGINVALLTFPLGMAYAMIAGLPVQFGIYGSAVAAIVGPFFFSSRFLISGPSNATAVLVLSSFLLLRSQFEISEVMPLFLFMVGSFLVIGALVGVAGLVQYVSRTVVTGYITAASLHIMVNQLQNVLGYKVLDAATIWDISHQTLLRLPETSWPSLLLGVATACFWLLVRKKFPALPSVLAAIVGMSVVGFAMDHFGLKLAHIQEMPFGRWPVTLPHLNFTAISSLASAAVAVAFLSVLEATSISKSLANRSGDRVDSNQEMLGLGVANLACGLFGGMPASGSLTRSVLNWSSGAVTPLAGILSGVFCAMAALLLGPLVGAIPQTVLAAVVICVSFSLIAPDQIRIALKSTKSDRAVFISTFVAGILFKLDFSIYLGTFVSIILFLKKASRPELVEYSFNEEGHLYEIQDKLTRPNPQISIVHVEGELFFGAAELFRDQVRRVCDDPNLQVIILRLRNAYHLDATSVMALMELIRYLRESSRYLIISGARKDVYRVCRDSGLLDVLGRDNIFLASPQNPNLATRNALKRAKELIGKGPADIRIFYDPTRGPKA